MESKHGVTGVVFFRTKTGPVFLLLHRVLNWAGWEFPKGGIEAGEESKEACIREIREESGIVDVEVISKLAEGIEWQAKGKNYIYDAYLVEAKTKKAKIDQKVQEHDSFKWVNGKHAMDLLKHSENKMLLEKALDFLFGEEQKELLVLVSGQVQGVFFRAFAQLASKEIGGITGYAKNLPDGHVEIVGQGQGKKLKEFLSRVKQGPPLAKVEKAVEKWSNPKKKYSSFQVM